MWARTDSATVRGVVVPAAHREAIRRRLRWLEAMGMTQVDPEGLDAFLDLPRGTTAAVLAAQGQTRTGVV